MRRPIVTIIAVLLLFTSLGAAIGVVWWYFSFPGMEDRAERTERGVSITAAERAAHINDLNMQINLLRYWTPWRGTFEELNPGLRGIGESSADFDPILPGNIRIRFAMNVVDGMRPRFYLEGPGIYVGNEGFERQIFVYGSGRRSVQGKPVPYVNGQSMQISLTIDRGSFQLLVDNNVIVGKCKPCDSIRLRAEGGDSWSKGTTEYRSIQIQAVDASGDGR